MAIFVSGFDFGTPDDAIADHFGAVGAVSSIESAGKGNAVVRFNDPDAARRAVAEMDETTIAGNRRYVRVKLDGDKGSKGGKKGGKSGGKGYDRYEDRTTYSGELQTGTVAKFLTDRGFGYIAPDQGGDDIFVHFSAICGSGFRELAQGDRVSFGVERDPKGKGKQSFRAVAVNII